MPSPTDPSDETFEGASSRLDEGLKSCRAVLSGYRALLCGEGESEPAQVGLNDDGAPGEENAA